MVIRSCAIKQCGILTVLAVVLLWGSFVAAQSVTEDRNQQALGSVRVGDHTVSLSIAYQADSALVTASVTGKNNKQRYIPLIGSTFRGVSSFQIDIISPDANNEIWIRMSKPNNDVLAHYRLGSETALTPFGQIKLLETPFPDHISGGPVEFPKPPADARVRASFYYYESM